MEVSHDGDLTAWAEIKGITRSTLKVLQRQGIMTIQDLALLDLPVLEASDLVTSEQCQVLGRVVDELLYSEDVTPFMGTLAADSGTDMVTLSADSGTDTGRLSADSHPDTVTSSEAEPDVSISGDEKTADQWTELEEMGLTRRTLEVLRVQGVTSRQDLLGLDIALLEQSDLVSSEQCRQLEKIRDLLLTGSDVTVSMFGSPAELDSDLSPTCLENRLVSEEEELTRWAGLHDITQETLGVLRDQGVSSLQDLPSLDICLLEQSGLVPTGQCLLLGQGRDGLLTESEELSFPPSCDCNFVSDTATTSSFLGESDGVDSLQSPKEVCVAHVGKFPLDPLLEHQLLVGTADDRTTDSDEELLTVTSSHEAGSSVECRRDHRVLNEHAVRFFLVGKTGCGKSTTGNTILGQELFTQEVSFSSVTSTCSFQWCDRNDIVIEITDSPGLCDTKRRPEDVAGDVVQAVACMHPGPTAILYVIAIGRYTEEDHGVYERVKSLFDPEVTQYIIIIFTRGDELTKKEKSIEDVLRTAPDNLSKTLDECGHRYVVFDNTAHDKQPQVDKLIAQVRELSEKHGGKPYTCPKYGEVGSKMENELQRRLQKVEDEEVKRKKYVQDLEVKMKQVREESEREKREFERKEKERVEMKMKAKAENERQMKALTKQLERQQLSAEIEQARVERLKQEYEHFVKEMERSKKKELDRLQAKNREMDGLLRKQAASLQKDKATKRRLQKQEEELRKLKQTVSRNNSSVCSVM